MEPTHTALYTGEDGSMGLREMSFYRINVIRDTVIVHISKGATVRIPYTVGGFLSNWGQIETYQEHLDDWDVEPVKPLPL